jgi:DNA-binding MurR/RpiR family transcriptional regulator
MTVRQLIEEKSEEFTSSERKLSAALLADYPFAGLEPIQTLAS